MSHGDQFKPIDKPYLKFWQECLDKPHPRPTKELDRVVTQIKKGKLPKGRKQ